MIIRFIMCRYNINPPARLVPAHPLFPGRLAPTAPVVYRLPPQQGQMITEMNYQGDNAPLAEAMVGRSDDDAVEA